MEAPPSLSEVLAPIPDPRDASGLRYPFPAVLNLPNVYRVRDVTFGEGASRIRRGDSPQALAAFRNALTHLLSTAKAPNFAAALRRFASGRSKRFD